MFKKNYLCFNKFTIYCLKSIKFFSIIEKNNQNLDILNVEIANGKYLLGKFLFKTFILKSRFSVPKNL